jgi:glutamate dehydrogenase
MDIEALDGKIEFAAQAQMLISISSFIESMTLWLLRNVPQPIKVEKTIALFGKDIAEFEKVLSSVISKHLGDKIETTIEGLSAAKVPVALATKVANLQAMLSACDVALVAKQGKLPLKTVAKIYFEVGATLNLSWLRTQASKLSGDNYWERLALKNLITSLFDQQRRISAEVMKLACVGDKCDDAVKAWSEKNAKELDRHKIMIDELKASGELSLAMLVAAVRRTENINAA